MHNYFECRDKSNLEIPEMRDQLERTKLRTPYYYVVVGRDQKEEGIIYSNLRFYITHLIVTSMKSTIPKKSQTISVFHVNVNVKGFLVLQDTKSYHVYPGTLPTLSSSSLVRILHHHHRSGLITKMGCLALRVGVGAAVGIGICLGDRPETTALSQIR